MKISLLCLRACVRIHHAKPLFPPGVRGELRGREAWAGRVGGEMEKVGAKRGERASKDSERRCEMDRDTMEEGARSRAPFCYNMTLTGLCNRTGLVFASQQQTPAALTVM